MQIIYFDRVHPPFPSLQSLSYPPTHKHCLLPSPCIMLEANCTCMWASHWSMCGLSGIVSPKKADCPSPSNHQLPVAPQLGAIFFENNRLKNEDFPCSQEIPQFHSAAHFLGKSSKYNDHLGPLSSKPPTMNLCIQLLEEESLHKSIAQEVFYWSIRTWVQSQNSHKNVRYGSMQW